MTASGSAPTQRQYARNEDERCFYEDCWLVNGHDGLHAYHPAITGSAPTEHNTTEVAEVLCAAICDLLGEPRILFPGEMRALLNRRDAAAALESLIAARVRTAQADAWDESAEEGHALGWLHDDAYSDLYDRNPYRADRLHDTATNNRGNQ